MAKKTLLYLIKIEPQLQKSLNHFKNIVTKILSSKKTWKGYTFIEITDKIKTRNIQIPIKEVVYIE